jgi:integrase
MQTPKTKAGARLVSLPQAAIAALQRQQTRQQQDGEATDGDAPIFRTVNGNPPRYEHLRDILGPLCVKASVPRLNVHGLRHVAAMLAMEAGADVYLVQQRLGHAHVSITLGIHGYSARDQTTVADGLDALLGASR